MTTPRSRSRLFSSAVACLAMLSTTACDDGDWLGPDLARSPSSGHAAGVVAANHEARPVPFKGTLTGELVPDASPSAGCVLAFHTAQAGELVHLGRFAGTGGMCATNVQVGVLDPPVNPGGGPPPYFVADFVIELTYAASNGDLLQLTGTGVLVQSLTNGASGLAGVGTVEGGTGRFRGATGAFDVVGVAPTVTYDGWIAYDASNRSE